MMRTAIVHRIGFLAAALCGFAGCTDPSASVQDGADRDLPTPPITPVGWVSYEPEPDGLIDTPFPGIRLAGPLEIYPRLSAGGRRIVHAAFGESGPTTLLLFGMHGSEYTPALLGFQIHAWLESNPDAVRGGRIVVAPLIDPDGLVSGVRGNDHRVDLNRNYPARNWKHATGANRDWHGSSPASEAETQFVLMLLERYRPDVIVSVHAPEACVNYDGPAESLAHAMSSACSLPVEASIGYPTPGSFGSYAGYDQGIPTITFELSSKRSLTPDFEACRRSLMATHRYALERYP